MQFILLLFCLFELICVPAVFLGASLTALTVIYGIVVLSAVIAVAVVNRIKAKSQDDKIISDEAETKVSLLQKIKQGLLETETVTPIYFAALLLILYQLFLVLAYQHNDADDALYIGTAVTSLQTNSLFRFSSYSGMAWELVAAKDYVLSPYPILLAVLSKLTGVHPSVLAHNVFPPLMIIWAYAVYWKLGKTLFEKQKEREYFLVFISILYIFGYYSTRTIGTFLLFRSWQGKSVFCTVMIPLLFYYFLGIARQGKGRDKGNFKSDYTGFLLTNFAATLTSFSAVILMPLLTGFLAVTYAVFKKDIKVPFLLLLTVLPNVVLVGLNLFAF